MGAQRKARYFLKGIRKRRFFGEPFPSGDSHLNRFWCVFEEVGHYEEIPNWFSIFL